jgi:hypothetical protein
VAAVAVTALALAAPATAATPAERAQARRLLVAPADLGAGWTAAGPGERSRVCRVIRQPELVLTVVSPEYRRGAAVVVSLASLTRTPAAAARAVAHARTAGYRSCLVRAYARLGFLLSARPLPPPRLGVGAAANRFVIAGRGVTAVVVQVVMARGARLVGINVSDADAPTRRRALARLARRLGA